jgi:hypothetical protein
MSWSAAYAVTWSSAEFSTPLAEPLAGKDAKEREIV